MSRLLILAEIKTLLESVTDIGQVHDSIRWSVSEDKFAENFITQVDERNELRTWMIYRSAGGMDYGAREGSLGTGVTIPTRTSLRRHDFVIEGWASFADDDTDATFQALVDAVLDKFETEITLNNSALTRGPIEYNIDHQFFGEILAHHVTLNFYAVERAGITPT